MAEPAKIGSRAPERITYTTNAGAQGSALVRRNRTVESTQAQWERIWRNNPTAIEGHNYLRLARAFTRTLRAMDATDRPNPYGAMYQATLVSRRNNRK